MERFQPRGTLECRHGRFETRSAGQAHGFAIRRRFGSLALFRLTRSSRLASRLERKDNALVPLHSTASDRFVMRFANPIDFRNPANSPSSPSDPYSATHTCIRLSSIPAALQPRPDRSEGASTNARELCYDTTLWSRGAVLQRVVPESTVCGRHGLGEFGRSLSNSAREGNCYRLKPGIHDGLWSWFSTILLSISCAVSTRSALNRRRPQFRIFVDGDDFAVDNSLITLHWYRRAGESVMRPERLLLRELGSTTWIRDFEYSSTGMISLSTNR